MLAALKGIAENRDSDAAILSQENGKVRYEGWVDSLVLELRWKLALSHADEVNAAKVLPPIHGAIPVETMRPISHWVWSPSSCRSTGLSPFWALRPRMRCLLAIPSL